MSGRGWHPNDGYREEEGFDPRVLPDTAPAYRQRTRDLYKFERDAAATYKYQGTPQQYDQEHYNTYGDPQQENMDRPGWHYPWGRGTPPKPRFPAGSPRDLQHQRYHGFDAAQVDTEDHYARSLRHEAGEFERNYK